MTEIDINKYLSDIKPSILPKWKRNDLLIMRDDGYNIIPLCNEDQAIRVRTDLKKEGKCAQSGYLLTSDGKYIYFTITRDRGKVTKNEN